MPPPKKKVYATGITRVLLKDDGWVEIKPGTFRFTSLDFWVPTIEGQPDVFTGLTYLGFEFEEAKTGKVYCVPTDGIGAIEVVKEGS